MHDTTFHRILWQLKGHRDVLLKTNVDRLAAPQVEGSASGDQRPFPVPSPSCSTSLPHATGVSAPPHSSTHSRGSGTTEAAADRSVADEYLSYCIGPLIDWSKLNKELNRFIRHCDACASLGPSRSPLPLSSTHPATTYYPSRGLSTPTI